MQVHFGTELLKPEWAKSVVCMGTFDGVHIGHQAVISNAVTRAESLGLPCVLVTFDRHPASILAPNRCPKAINSLSKNLDTIRECGVSLALVLPFDAALSRMSAEVFLDRILLTSVRGQSIVVGHDFAMGQGREGTAEWLATRMATTVVPPVLVDGVRVSSSLIRDAISAGDMATATKMLGRPFAISGFVVQGQQLGRTLGYPTANVGRSFDQIMPADGIYAGRMTFARGLHYPKGTFDAAISIGNRPTVNGDSRTIEAYLLDYPGDAIYGYNVQLELLEYLRPELRFECLDALVVQMGKDVQRVRAGLAAL